MKKFKKVYIEITNICNLNCSFCNNNKREKKFMNVSDFSHIIDEVKSYTDYIYLHVKGEPLLNPNLDIFLDICDNNNLFVNITTNGTLLKKSFSVLNKHKCIRQINVSLHSENYDEEYLEDVFWVCSNLSDKIYISYRLWTLNNYELDKKSTRVVEKIISYYTLSPDVAEKLYKDKQIKIYDNTYVNKDNLFEWPSMNSNHSSLGYCHGTIDHIGILVDGTVIPCCLDGEGVISLGNVLSTDLGEILGSERFVNMSEGFKNNTCSEEFCKKCSFKDRFR
ncbi:MAG: radical SAM protein [Firmicutes bacterium]|nr:radical SAM protein [Bacillota bacterium]